jgi:predicted  nucleic acid-binding Zn-ribbon protein
MSDLSFRPYAGNQTAATKASWRPKFEACHKECVEIRAELETFRKEADDFEANISAPLRSYCAIGFKNLSAADLADAERLLKDLKPAKDRIEDKSSKLAARSKACSGRQDHIIDASKKYIAAVENHLDQGMVTQVDRMAGLISYGMACGNLGGPLGILRKP